MSSPCAALLDIDTKSSGLHVHAPPHPFTPPIWTKATLWPASTLFHVNFKNFDIVQRLVNALNLVASKILNLCIILKEEKEKKKAGGGDYGANLICFSHMVGLLSRLIKVKCCQSCFCSSYGWRGTCIFFVIHLCPHYFSSRYILSPWRGWKGQGNASFWP